MRVNAIDSRYHISSVSPTIITNDQFVTVTFNTTAIPTQDDWIGAYSPPPSLVPGSENYIFNSVPVKYGMCFWSGTSTLAHLHGDYLSTGVGSLTFNLTNLRADVAFYYLSGVTNFNSTDFSDTIVEAAATQQVSFQNINEPLRNRVVPTSDTNIYNVLWSAASMIRPMLRWGFESNQYTFNQPAAVSNITKSSLCGAPANTTGWRDLGNIYTAPIVGIDDLNLHNSYIYYMFGDNASNTWSGEFKFLIPPKVGTNPVSRGTRLVLMADMGVGSTGQSLETCKYRCCSGLFAVFALLSSLCSGLA
jgi:hypothetical protein